MPAPVVVPAGTPAADAVAAAGLPSSGPKAIVVVRDPAGRLRDLDWVPELDTDVTPVSLDEPDGLNVLRHSAAHVLAQAVQDVFPEAKLGIGPPITDGFYYDFDVAKPFQPEDLSTLEKRMQEIVKAGQTFRRREYRSLDKAKVELAGEPYKLELVDLKGDVDANEVMEVGHGELTHYDNLDRDGKRVWGDLCRGPHLPSTRFIPAFKLMRVGRRVLAREREEPAAAAHLRHRVAVPRRAQGVPQSSRRGRAPRPPQARRRARPVLVPRRDRLRPGRLPPQGRCDQAGDGGLRPAAGTSRRASSTSAPRTSARRACSTPPGHLPYYKDTMFPPMHFEGADYYLKAMNCPMHNLIFKSRGTVLPGAAAATVRVRVGLPVREVGRRARPDPGARHDPGRLALVRHRRAGRRARSSTCSTSCCPCCATSGWTTSTWSCRPGTRRATSSSARDEQWAVATKVLEDVCVASGPGTGARPGRRGVLRPEDLGAGPGRDRPHLADVDHPVRLQPAGPVRPGVPGGRRHPAGTGDDPLGEVRVDRAVLRGARRALRGRVPGLAGPGAGGRHPDPGRPRRLPDRPSPTGCAGRASGPRSTTPTTGCRRRSAPPSSRRSRSW